MRPPTTPSSAVDLDEFIFVLEQTLGNKVHGRNLESVAARQPGMHVRTVRLDNTGPWHRDRPAVTNWTLAASLWARREVRRLLRERPAGALYVHTSLSASLLVDVMRRTPTVVSTDATPRNMDTLAGSYDHRVRGPRVEEVKRRITRAAYTGAYAVVAQSQWTADSMIGDYDIPSSKVHVIAQGADLQRFRREERAPGGPVRLLFVGADFTRKGGALLTAAFRQLHGDVELDLVTAADLPAAAGVRVHRGLDHRSPTLFQLFARADVFVLPTLGDAAPLVLGEALAAGLPIVSSRVGAVPEMVVDAVTGLTVQPGSLPPLVSALQTLVDSPELRARYGAAGRQLAVERYDCDGNNKRVIALLREAALRGREVGA